ncbi:hypothetical protein BGX28_000759, partial [Mortierella sp. GBA30]
MSIVESLPSSAASPSSSLKSIAQKKARNARKPSQDEKNKELKGIDDKITQLRSRLDVVREAIASMMDKKESVPRTSLRNRLTELRELQAATKKSKQAKVDQLNDLNAAIKKKIADLKTIQDKLPYKTNEAVDAQIRWQDKIGRGEEITQRNLYSYQEQKVCRRWTALQAAINADKEAIAALRGTIDDQGSKAQSDEYNAIQAQLDEITQAKDDIWKRRNELFDERVKLQKDIDAEYQRKRTINDEYFAAVREYAKFLQDEQSRRKEEFHQKKLQELEEEMLAIAKEQRDVAEIPAFQAEITTCDSVYKYLLQFNKDHRPVDTKNVASTTGAPAYRSNSNIRQVDMTTNVPQGVMLAKKADKVEEVFYGGGAKSKKNRSKERRADCAWLKLPLAVIEQLIELKIIVPTSSADLGKTLDALSEKSNMFKLNQAKATSENKRKAEERIAKLILSDLQSIDSIVEQTEIVPEIEATA